jgi:hypothetical protein
MQIGIARRSCVPDFIKIGREILTVHVKVHSRSSVKYDYRYVGFHETHACSTTFSNHLTYRLSRKPAKWTDECFLHIKLFLLP